ncbi:MAG: site-specific integrase [Streptosporangiaceae bacterium]|nr:site-specific integrase [Streptosporangiaceae bacterium]
MPSRKPNNRSSIYLGKDGWWHGWVTIGIKDDGSPDRRHRKARTEAAVTRKVRELERHRDNGNVTGAGRPVTVGQWMETWLTTVAPRRIRRSTLDSTYAPKVRNRIIPGLGKHRLDRLTPEHIEQPTRLEAEGLAPATVLQIHRILSRALKVAMQRGYVAWNVATLVDAPAASQDEIEPLTLEEALRIIRLSTTRRNGTRWSIALALGLRQGEALGLRWQHVDLAAGTLVVRWQLQRLAWRHGCPAPYACARDHHRDDCPPYCARHARSCPRRSGGGLQLTELKSDKSRRTIALPPQLAAALKAHRAAQLQERMTAGSAWHDGGFVWCQASGRPIDPHADWDEWKALLETAGIRPVRVHDARHTAATLLLAQGVDQRVVTEILGHSQISMTSRYAHVLPQVMTDAAERIGRALWGEA